VVVGCFCLLVLYLATTEDYALLQKLNEATSAEYVGMTETAQGLNVNMADLRKKCECLVYRTTHHDGWFWIVLERLSVC
jgi:hypothetical protein